MGGRSPPEQLPIMLQSVFISCTFYPGFHLYPLRVCGCFHLSHVNSVVSVILATVIFGNAPTNRKALDVLVMPVKDWKFHVVDP